MMLFIRVKATTDIVPVFATFLNLCNSILFLLFLAQMQTISRTRLLHASPSIDFKRRMITLFSFGK